MKLLHFTLFLFYLTTIKPILCEDKIRKCCKSGESVFVSNSFDLKCQHTTYGTVRNSTDFGLPDCKEYAIEEVTVSKKSVETYCMDMIVDKQSVFLPKNTFLGSITCKIPNKNDENININPKNHVDFIRKCCHQNEKFDFKTRSCVSKYTPNENTAIPFQGKKQFLEIKYNDLKCSLTLEDTEYSKKNKLPQINMETSCIEKTTTSSDSWIVRTCSRSNFCDKHTCITKCCANDEILIAPNCVPLKNNSTFKTLHHTIMLDKSERIARIKDKLVDSNEKTGLTIHDGCPYGAYKVSNPAWYISKDGNVHIDGILNAITNQEYCFDIKETAYRQSHVVLYTCVEEPSNENKVTATLMWLSSFLITATCLIYNSSATLRKQHGRCSFYLFFAYSVSIILLAVKETKFFVGKHNYEYFVYTIIYFCLASYIWLTILSYNVFRSLKKLASSTTYLPNDRRFIKMLLYNLFGWGIPAAILSFIIYLDRILNDDDSFKPHINKDDAWFPEHILLEGSNTYILKNKSQFLYLMVPQASSLISSMIFLLFASVEFFKVQMDIGVTSTNINRKAEDFKMCKAQTMMIWKFLAVMGIPWFYLFGNIVMKLKNWEYHWIYNIFSHGYTIFACQGLLMFVILIVCNFRVIQNLLKVQPSTGIVCMSSPLPPPSFAAPLSPISPKSLHEDSISLKRFEPPPLGFVNPTSPNESLLKKCSSELHIDV